MGAPPLPRVMDLLGAAREAAVAAGATIRRARARHPVRYKANRSSVTRADLAAERTIRTILAKRSPGVPVLGEEGGLRGGDSPWRWVVDPLDGTHNYVHGYPFYGVSIALCRAGDPVVGVVLDVVRGRRYEATAGGGARRDGHRIRVTRLPLLRGLVATGFYYDRGVLMRTNLDVLGRVMPRSQGLRRSGSAALDLCAVADGTLAAYWELNVRPWDVAAGILLVREAGGAATYGPARIGRRTVPCVVAGTRHAVRAVRAALVRSGVSLLPDPGRSR